VTGFSTLSLRIHCCCCCCCCCFQIADRGPATKQAEQQASSPSPLDDNVRKQLDGTVALDRPRLVVLGSGWGSMSLVKALPRDIRCALKLQWLVVAVA
jgi:hypothetical protein